MAMCCDQIVGDRCPTCGKVHVTQTIRCRDKLCAICAGALARKRYTEMVQVYDAISPIFAASTVGMLTLTVRNCRLAALPDTLRAMSTAYKRLTQRVWWRSHVIGAARNLEITYNADSRTYHPHYHVLLLTQGDGTRPGQMMPALVDMWREALRLDYNPVIDYRAAYSLRGDADGQDIVRAAWLEASKYMVKADTIDSIPDRDFAAFVAAIEGVRSIGYSGVIRDARKALKLPDDDTAPAEDAPMPTCTDCHLPTVTILAQWANGVFVGPDGEVVDI